MVVALADPLGYLGLTLGAAWRPSCFEILYVGGKFYVDDMLVIRVIFRRYWEFRNRLVNDVLVDLAVPTEARRLGMYWRTRPDGVCELRSVLLGGLGDVIDDGATLSAREHSVTSSRHGHRRVSNLIEAVFGAAVGAFEVAGVAVPVVLCGGTRGRLLLAEEAVRLLAFHERHDSGILIGGGNSVCMGGVSQWSECSGASCRDGDDEGAASLLERAAKPKRGSRLVPRHHVMWGSAFTTGHSK